MLTYHKMSVEVTSSTGNVYDVTVRPALPEDPGTWEIEIKSIGPGKHMFEYSNVATMKEALNIGLMLLP